MWSFSTVTSGDDANLRPLIVVGSSSKSVAVKSTKQLRRKPRRDPTIRSRSSSNRNSRLSNLTLDINNLKQEIHNLALRRQLLHTRALYESRLTSDCSAVRKAAHYFQGFARGFRGRQTHVSQDAFVRSIADEDFSIGVTGLGVDMLLEQWRRYTELFCVRENVVHSVGLLNQTEEYYDDESAFVLIKCVLTFHGIFTRDAVEMISPSAARDPQLLLRVLGQKLVCPMVFHLYFNARGQLVRHDADADFFLPVRRALGGDNDAAVRFMGALRLGQESMVGPINGDEETAIEPQSELDRDIGDHESWGDDEDAAGGETVDSGDAGDLTASHRHALAFLLT